MTEMMTQDEINAMMRGSDDSPEAAESSAPSAPESIELDEMEKDALGEVSNICMGTCATTLYTLLNRRVSITTPEVTVGTIKDHIGEFEAPFIAAGVEYVEGITGSNIFILKQDDVLLMTDLLMGGEGELKPGAELDELAFSAISEVMNQMVGSSSTSLADVLGRTINISTPNVKKMEFDNADFSEFLANEDITIKVSFTMEIENLLTSKIMQIIPFESGMEILNKILGEEEAVQEPQQAPEVQNVAPPVEPVAPPPTPVAPPQAPPTPQKDQNMIGVKAVQYESFDGVSSSSGAAHKQDNMGLIMEVPINVTVELGNCKKSIKEILSFTTGSVIVLNRMAGEMVDIMVNGVLYAVGEVVVIDDSYGVRITEIINKPG